MTVSADLGKSKMGLPCLTPWPLRMVHFDKQFRAKRAEGAFDALGHADPGFLGIWSKRAEEFLLARAAETARTTPGAAARCRFSSFRPS